MQATINTPRGPLTIKDGDFIDGNESFDVDNHRYGIELYCLVHGDEVIGLVFARHDQEALDELTNAGRLDRWMLEEGEVVQGENGDTDDCGEAVTRLGNAGEPFVLPFMKDDLFKIPTPKLSVVSMLAPLHGGFEVLPEVGAKLRITEGGVTEAPIGEEIERDLAGGTVVTLLEIGEELGPETPGRHFVIQPIGTDEEWPIWVPTDLGGHWSTFFEVI